jgi:AcrR family transcriptional regulator
VLVAQPKATTVEAVLRAAATLFARDGYQATTIEDIAREAGISKPTVYQYAKSKQWILEQIVHTVCADQEYSSRTVYDLQAPPNVRFYWLIRVHVIQSIRYRTYYGVTLSELSDLSHEAREEFRQWAHRSTNAVRDLLLECKGQGSPVSGHVTTTANLVVSMLSSLYRWYDPRGDVPVDALTDHIAGVFSSIVDPPSDLDAWPRPDWPHLDDFVRTSPVAA